MRRFFEKKNKMDFVVHRLNHIEVKLDFIIERLDKMSATIDQVLQDVSDESTLEDSIITLLEAIKAQLDAALANTTIPADVQTKIDAVFAGLEANKQKVADAIKANTPEATS